MNRKAPTLIPTTAETLISGRRVPLVDDDDAEMNPLPDSDPPRDPDPKGDPLRSGSDPVEEEDEASRNSSGSSSCS